MPKQIPNTTCQICGRPIQAKHGMIAHHGYKRPDYGWQTASCLGARHQPYQVACDAIQPVIELIEKHIAKVSATYEKFVSTPPATLDYEKRNYRGFGKYEVEIKTAVRPENFDPNERMYLSEYEGQYASVKRNMEQDIKHSTFQIDYLKERLANWKAVI